MTKEDKKGALEALYSDVAGCHKCPLRQTAIQSVPGEGNPNSDIVFVGEGPGKAEDEQGKPFVGAAGKFLTTLIESIGYKREDIYIANVVKHRPPSNRDPLPDELEACTPWLDEQIKIIEPKLIVTLGRFSMSYFLGESMTISNIHGQPKRHNGQVIMPMYHPAAALYRGNLRPVLLADFAKIPKILELIEKDNSVTSETLNDETKEELPTQQATML
jgi:uracil-DNA glycosylase